jgi:PEP-CTERM motif
MATSIVLRRIAAVALASGCAFAAQGQTLGGEFSADYSFVNLGSVAGLPSNYGGLAFLDSDTILIGGQANTASGSLYTIDVTRDASNHITGFVGSATRFGGASGAVGEYNDGGVTFGPGGVLFTSRWPVNGLGQSLPGSLNEDKIIDLTALGVANSHAAINFVPPTFGGAGQAKLVSWAGGQWYSATLSPDGRGTFDLGALTQIDLNPVAAGIQNVPGGPEGFVYIAAGNASFAANAMLISEYSAGAVGAYDVDAQGNPLVASRRTFLSGLTGAEGAVIDPMTGDFLFSTFGGGSRVVRVSGFTVSVDPTPPMTPVPEPSTWALILLGLAAVAGFTRRARKG